MKAYQTVSPFAISKTSTAEPGSRLLRASRPRLPPGVSGSVSTVKIVGLLSLVYISYLRVVRVKSRHMIV